MFKMRRSKKRVFVMLVVIFVTSFGSTLFSSAFSPNDAATVISTVKPDSSTFWIQRGSSSAFPFELGTSNLSKPSSQWFRNVGGFNYSSSFGGVNVSSLTYFSYDNQLLEWTPGFVYSITINFRMSTFEDATEDQASNLLLVFPVGSVPTTTFSGSDYKSYFYNGFAPSRVYKRTASQFDITYNVPVYPETTFSRSTLQNGIYYSTGFGFLDSHSGMIISGQQPSGSWVYQQTFIFVDAPVVSVYTPEQFQTQSTLQSLGGLSEQIDFATGQVISAIDNQTSEIIGGINNAVDDLLDAGDPVDSSGLTNFHNKEQQLGNAIVSTMPFSASAVAGFFDTDHLQSVLVGANTVRDWLQYVYDHNQFVWTLVSVAIAYHCLNMVLKSLF